MSCDCRLLVDSFHQGTALCSGSLGVFASLIQCCSREIYRSSLRSEPILLKRISSFALQFLSLLVNHYDLEVDWTSVLLDSSALAVFYTDCYRPLLLEIFLGASPSFKVPEDDLEFFLYRVLLLFTLLPEETKEQQKAVFEQLLQSASFYSPQVENFMARLSAILNDQRLGELLQRRRTAEDASQRIQKKFPALSFEQIQKALEQSLFIEEDAIQSLLGEPTRVRAYSEFKRSSFEENRAVIPANAFYSEEEEEELEGYEESVHRIFGYLRQKNLGREPFSGEPISLLFQKPPKDLLAVLGWTPEQLKGWWSINKRQANGISRLNAAYGHFHA